MIWNDCVGDEAAEHGPVLWPVVRDQHRSVTHFEAIGSERDNEDGATAADFAQRASLSAICRSSI